MKKIILGVMVLLMGVSLYGCSTIKGIGDDLSAVGGWVSRGSDHVKESVGKNPPGSGMER